MCTNMTYIPSVYLCVFFEEDTELMKSVKSFKF